TVAVGPLDFSILCLSDTQDAASRRGSLTEFAGSCRASWQRLETANSRGGSGISHTACLVSRRHNLARRWPLPLLALAAKTADESCNLTPAAPPRPPPASLALHG